MRSSIRRARSAAMNMICVGALALAGIIGAEPTRAAATPAANGVTVIQGAPDHVISVDCAAITGTHRYFVPYTVTPTGADTLQVRGLSTCNSKSHGRYNTAIGPSTTCGGGSFQSFCGAGLYNLNQGLLDQASLYRNTRYQLFTRPGDVVEIIFYWALDTRYPAGVWTPKTQAIASAIGATITPTLAYSIDGPSTPTFSIAPPLPAGLALDPATGVITGTPTTTHPTTTHTVTATMGQDAPTATVTVSVGTHRVGFNGNASTSPFITAGTLPAALFAVNDGDSITLPAGPTRLNHGFNGWFTSPTDPATKVGDPGDAYTPTGTVTLYAQWTPPYVVSYDRQGGSGSGTASVVPGGSVTLPSTSRSALTLAGWFDAPSGGNLVGAANASFTPSASTTLYAQWTATVGLTLNGGSLPAGTPTSRVINVNSAGSMTLPTPTRSGHRFLGWWSSTGGGTFYGDGEATYTVTSNVTMQARWLALVRVDFDPLYGSLADGRCQMLSGLCRIWWGSGDPAFVLPTITSSRGLTFDGWYTASSGGTRRGGGGNTWNSPSSTTLRAQWTGVRTFDPNGGSVTVASRSGKAGTTGALEVPYRPGFAFVHWVASNPPFGPTTLARSANTRMVEQTETLTAQWNAFPDAPALRSASLSADRTTVRLQFSGDLQTLYSTGSATLCNEFRVVSVPKDAAFDDRTAGRSCTVNGSVIEIARSDASLSLDSTAMTVAYAGRALAASGDATEFVEQTGALRVEDVGYELSFNGNGGNPDAPRRAIAAGRPLTLPGAARPGLTLAGWFTRASGGDLVGREAQAVTPSSDATLFAQWQARVAFEAEGITDPSVVEVNIDSDAPISLPGVERAGFTFAGWFSQPTGGDFIGDAGAPFMPAEDTTLHARWISVPVPAPTTDDTVATPVVVASPPATRPRSPAARATRMWVRTRTLRLRGNTLRVRARTNGAGTALIRGYRTAGPGKGPVVVCSGTPRFATATTRTLACMPTKAAQALRAQGTVRVRIDLVFTPRRGKVQRIVVGRIALPAIGPRAVAVTG